MRRAYELRLISALWLVLAIALIAFPGIVGAGDDFTHFRMANGLDVFIKEDHARKVAAVQLWVMVGSAYENDSERGISHLIEHMAFKGTKKRPTGRIDQEVQEIGGQIDAYTSWDETVFHIVVPSEAAAQGLDIVTDAVFRAVIDPKELEKEKKVVLEEILEGKDRPEDVASDLLFETAYTKSPYRFPVIGHKDVVEKLTRSNILNFRAKWYVPENMFLIVVGDVNPAAVKQELERLTQDVKPTPFFRPPLPQEPRQTQIRGAVLRDANATETRLDVAFHIPSIKGNDVNALDLAANILGGRENSRLVSDLKQEKAVVHSISASSLTPKEPGLMIFSATLDARNLEAATRGIMEQLAHLSRNPPTADELELAKINIESQHVYAGETVQGTAKSMGTYQNDLGDANYADRYLMLNAAVTPKQLSAAVARYLVPPNVTVSVLLPRGELEDFRIEQLEKIVSDFKPIGQDADSASLAATPVLFKELRNGVKVVLAPDNAGSVVSFRIACLGGQRFETAETQGIMNFISRMLDKGAGRMTQQDIARKVDRMGGSLQGFSGKDSFGLYASFFSRHGMDAVELLYQLYSGASFPQDKFDRERDLIINDIKTEPDEPMRYSITVLNKTLFPVFPYGFDRLGTPATVVGFTAQELKQTYQRFAVPANTVISVVGQMDAHKVLERVDQLFGSIPARAMEMPQVNPEQPLDKPSEAVLRIPRAQAHLAIGFRSSTLSDPDRFALDVLTSVLGGQGGRLFREIRDKEALVYTVTSFVRPCLSPGVLGLYLSCDPRNLDRAHEELVKQIDLIKASKVSDEELKRAVNNLIGNHLISLQSSSDRAELIGLHTLYGLGHDFDREYIKKLRDVKAEDLLDVAQKYLDLDRCAVVKILPESNEEAD